jgi:hypothetical protein
MTWLNQKIKKGLTLGGTVPFSNKAINCSKTSSINYIPDFAPKQD